MSRRNRPVRLKTATPTPKTAKSSKPDYEHMARKLVRQGLASPGILELPMLGRRR